MFLCHQFEWVNKRLAGASPVAEDDIQNLEEAVKWFELCTLLCNGDLVKQGKNVSI